MNKQRALNILQRYQRQGLFTHCFGAFGIYSPQNLQTISDVSILPERRTIFDLASLTKALVTAPLYAQLFLKTTFSLETKLRDLNPECAKYFAAVPRLSDVTLGQLLSHTSGYPAWTNFWINRLNGHKGKAFSESYHSHVREVLARSARFGDDQISLYSDIGYIVLGVAIELYYGSKLSDLFTGLLNNISGSELVIGFPNVHKFDEKMISSGFCKIRERELFGEVHDENCAALGGVCGHAGLFSSGTDLVKFIMLLFNSDVGRELLRWQSIDQFSYGLRPGDDPTSSVFGDGNAVGHLGFTGTAFWCDPKNSSYAVLLTNRIISGRISSEIKSFRRDFFSFCQNQLSEIR